MKIISNRFVLILFIVVIFLMPLGCNGSGSRTIPENLLSKWNQPLSKEVSTSNVRLASNDVDVAKRRSSDVALANYVGRAKTNNQAEWLKSYDEAVELSKQTGRPILADFTGSNWCSYCVKLEKEVFDTPKFNAWAAENVVLLKLDFPRPNRQPDWIKKQNNQLRSRYRIESYPTVKVLDANGGEIGSQGYLPGGPDRWIAVVDNTIKSNLTLQKIKLVDVVDLQDDEQPIAKVK